MKKYAAPILMLAIFETIAVTLWLTKGNIFYLFKLFFYILLGLSNNIYAAHNSLCL